MNQTTADILSTIAQAGWATVLTFKTREAKAAEELRRQGIIYIEAGNDQMWIVKFGRAPFGHTVREIV